MNASWIVSVTASVFNTLLTFRNRTPMQLIAAEIAKHLPTPPLKLSCRRLAAMAASMVRILGPVRRYLLTCFERQYQQPGPCQYVLRSCTSGHLQWKQDVDGHRYHQSAYVGKPERRLLEWDCWVPSDDYQCRVSPNTSPQIPSHGDRSVDSGALHFTTLTRHTGTHRFYL